MTEQTPGPLHRWLSEGDRAVFARVAAHHWPAGDRLLPRLTHSANHGLLWFGTAGVLWALGGARGRRAAARGVASLALASATVNTLGKRSVRRTRPLIDAVPHIRRARRQPTTTSFPSGHSASAAAFAVGVALESRALGTLLAPLAGAVAFSRVYTGVHYPSDVVVGAALGAGAAYAVRGLVPSRHQLPPPARPRGDAPALPEGEGLVVVVNPGSGAIPQPGDPVRQLRAGLPKAEVVLHDMAGPPLTATLDTAARDAAERGGALGVIGGDGTVSAAAATALRYGVPLAVLPGGTFNHFAQDLGVETVAEVCAAVESGSAVRVDVGRLTPTGEPGVSREPSYFVNTFSLGSYPELVRLREHWSPRIGGPAATLLGVAHVLRTSRPLRAVVNGEERSMWLLFAGNGAYRSVGLAPVRRYDLADGLLDLRVAHGGRFARVRLLTAALTGALRRSPVYAATRPRWLRISGLPEGTHMAYDGEVAPAPPSFVIDKAEEALTVYRTIPD
ncbi:bifunctional phosphatase PAP2/diacylglycerol kinase family protein [Streptomyces zingiberis]|uniref:Phosphatase PAP2 family protein n=1 Tax=Streptomyces zingiberis TaxID=2053010 RepID=A0ABX1BYZ2_9ACTN|nr:phosphatase PAP2 family protein [Streptomyces zingiberis]NJQ02856.1 phosphatase PAP2 family protein [Streptomyces zingiberis]